MFQHRRLLAITFLVTLLSMPGLVFAQQQAEAAQDEGEWAEITAGDKSFSAAFPGKPKQIRVPGKNGRVSVGFAWDSGDGKRMFGVIVDPYASPSPQAYLQGVKQGLVDKKTLISDKLLTWHDRPAADFSSTTKTEKGTPQHTHKRVVVDAKRVYMAMVMSLGEDVAAADVQKFFESFRLLTPYEPSAAGEPIAEGAVFRQPVFGLAMPLPEGWYITTQDVEDFRGESPAKGRRLLVVRERQVFKPTDGASFSINAHPADSEKATIAEYQRNEIKELAATFPFKMTLVAGPTPAMLGGREFVKSDYTVELGEQTLYARCYDRYEGGYAINIQGMAPTKEAFPAMDAVLKKLTFPAADENALPD